MHVGKDSSVSIPPRHRTRYGLFTLKRGTLCTSAECPRGTLCTSAECPRGTLTLVQSVLAGGDTLH